MRIFVTSAVACTRLRPSKNASLHRFECLFVRVHLCDTFSSRGPTVSPRLLMQCTRHELVVSVRLLAHRDDVAASIENGDQNYYVNAYRNVQDERLYGNSVLLFDRHCGGIRRKGCRRRIHRKKKKTLQSR